ncbi:FkbM family methyltransferase [Paenibacillus sp. P13VS]|uniref:FkbM family methyltransferase n=1 Tax=Paenibacillus sp. P13VS TaxID=2697367 RepID=UPI00187B7069|nr:FkbM family methyltransferase [Paenibacillus sp. P13VS]MBE7681560.1 hypothetical protein [Paenibacillus sp. P13VS]
MKFKSIEHEVIFKKLLEKKGEDNLSSLKSNLYDFEQTEQKHMSELHIHINQMLKTRENPAYRHLFSTRKFIGPVIVFGKKVVRKFLKWYIEPISLQQTEFNNATTSSIGKLTELSTELLSKTDEFDNQYVQRFEGQEQQCKKILEQLGQQDQNYNQLLSIVSEQRSQINSLLNEQLKLYSQLNELEKMPAMNSERIDTIEDSINKLYENEILQDDSNSVFIKQTYAQSGEDSILAYIVHVLGIPFEKVDYIDMGANHAKELSNTYFFYKKGAKGILVEANPELIPELKFYRHRDLILNYAIDIESEKNVKFYIMNGDGLSTSDEQAAQKFREINPNLDITDIKIVKTVNYRTIVEQYLGKAPVILSIDIEGKDLEILQSIDYVNYRPVIIVVEMVDYATTLSYKTKNKELASFLDGMEYDEYAFTGINSIFIDRKFLKVRE